MYVSNLTNFTKLCRLLETFFNTQKTFQRCLNVVVRTIWLRSVGQYQINVETTCMYTLKFTTFNNVKLMLSISTLILTTSDNAETMLPFLTSSFTKLTNVETKFCRQFSKSWKKQKKFFELQKTNDSLDYQHLLWIAIGYF